MKNINEPSRDMLAEYVRDRLFFVFNVVTKTKKEKQFKLRNIDARDPKNFRRSMRKIIIDGDEIKIPAQTTHVTEIRRYKSSSVLISDLNFGHLQWSRAVKSLNEPHLAWVYYCYGNKLDFNYQIVICQYIWSLFELKINELKIKLRKKTIDLLRNLTWIVVQNTVYRIRHQINLYSETDLALLSDKSLSSWSHNYSHYSDHLHSICYQLDHEALINVDRLYRSKN